MLRDPFSFASTPAAIGRVVTATITIACVLIVYVALQVVLQPGRAVEGGVAAGARSSLVSRLS